MRKWTMLLLISMIAGSTMHIFGQDTIPEKMLGIYPNPAIDHLTLDFHADNPVVPEILIHDLTGKVVLNPDDAFILRGENFKASLDISGLKSGIYFVKVVQAERVFSEKLVVR